MTSSLLVMRLKIESKRERQSKDEFYAFYLKKNKRSLLEHINHQEF